MDRPPLTTVFSTAVASATAFFVITRSGIAGTLAGAAVASLVYTGASHGIRHAAERLVARVRQWGPPKVETLSDEVRPATSTEGDGGLLAGTLLLAPPAPRRPAKSAVATWGPLLLAAGALVTSLYSVTTGTPIERVVVRERVVERPVVMERVVVQTQTVTAPPPTQGHASQPAAGSVGTPTTTTTVVATESPVTTTTTSTAPPTATTTSTVPPVSTTAPAAPSP